MRASLSTSIVSIALIVAACAGGPSAASPAGPTGASRPASPTASPTASRSGGSDLAVPSPTPTGTATAITGSAATPRSPSPTAGPTRTSGPTPTLTAKPTATPTPKPTPKPTAELTPRPTPGPTATTATLSLEARSFAFSPGALDGPAGVPFAIRFRNADAGVPHNVVIRRTTGEQLFSGSIITGDSTTTYRIPAIGAGTYAIACIVHPEMAGALSLR